ncbi:uncharacterized protein N7459_000631 [Penicillium hispanicum]|uniref:uncharacterized protein n=1 Tax=Penicillium hispanicum TaxID=1080232 RepID=UPI0025410B69|nr:uncharacterized protein N7459_000631 [Penicillium hispanicum]KAJ5594423.1 hypothetical protein N7459_000631 [Penicillium hispanicum]
MDSLVPRTDNTCTGNKQWYVCSAGDFRGCCSSDPCTSGVCPDDDGSTKSTTKTTSTTSSTSSESTSSSKSLTTISTTTQATTTSGTVPVTSLTTSSDTTQITSLSGASTIQSATSTSTATATTGKPSSHAAIIGGIVGGVAGLVMIAVLLFCWWRRPRERSFNVKFRRSVSSQHLHGREVTSRTKTDLSPSESEPLRLHGEHPVDTTRPSEQPIDGSSGSFPSLPNLALSRTGSNQNSNTNSYFTGQGASTAPSLSVPDLSTGPTGSAVTLITMNSGNPALSTTRDLPNRPPMNPSSGEIFPSVPRRPGYIPELSDTGFWRQRAELASHSQSELINKPLEQRRRQNLHHQHRHPPRHHKPGRSWDSSSSSSTAANSVIPSPSSATSVGNMSPRLMARNTARQVVTADGVVLGANLDRFSGGKDKDEEDQDRDRVKGKRRSQDPENHVMSFMTYQGDLEMKDRAGDRQREGAGVSRAVPALTVLEEAPFTPSSDVPPAYESGDARFSFERDEKSPSGTMGMRLRTVE